jgi:L-ectoine synthase
MIVRHFEEILPSSRAVHADNWSSFRLLTRDDGMGFSLHETWIHPGTETPIWYKHHFEAVYCIEGEGEIEPVDVDGRRSGAPIPIKPGMMYALNAHDRHLLRARTRLRLICVFNPPLRGDETHDADGAYAGPEAPSPETAPPLPAAAHAASTAADHSSTATGHCAACGMTQRHPGNPAGVPGRAAPPNARHPNAT